MKPFVIASLLLTLLPLTRAADPPLTDDARRCFEWYHSLGYPDLKEATWAEVWPGIWWNERGSKDPKAQTSHTFVLKADDHQFEVLHPAPASVQYKRQPNAAQPHARIDFEPRDFTDHVDRLLKRLPGSDDQRYGTMLGTPHWTQKTEVFVLACACWRKGDLPRAQALFTTADGMDDRQSREDPSQPEDMRHALERDLGQLAMWRAMLQAGGIALRYDSKQPLIPRAELLKAFQAVPARFPSCRHAHRAGEIVTLLKQMVAEDASHLQLTPEALAKLPIERQVEEQLFRLRDQNGFQFSQPGACDIFGDWFGGKSDTPAHRLVAFGSAAVPQLIDALADQRPTRSVEYGRDFFYSHRMLTVGDCAAAILRRISGSAIVLYHSGEDRTSTPEDIAKVTEQVRTWWKVVKEKGEKQALLDGIASGKEDPGEKVRKLREKDPGAGAISIREGARATENDPIAIAYVELLENDRTEEATQILLRYMGETEGLDLRLAAARALWNRQHPEALPGIQGMWTSLFPGKDTDGRMNSATSLLVVTLEPSSVDLLANAWPNCSAHRKNRIIEALLSELQPGGRDPKSRELSPAAVSAAVKLLVQALDDSDVEEGRSGSYGEFDYVSLRVCDLAALALHFIEPKTYAFTPRADRKQRDQERLAAANAWLRQQQLPERPAPSASLPVLRADQAMTISQVNIIRGTLTPAIEAFMRHAHALEGKPLTPSTLPGLLQHLLDHDSNGIGGLVIEAVRNRDLTGVTLDLLLEPGDLAAAAHLRFRSSALLGGTARGIVEKTVAATPAGQSPTWPEFETSLQPLLNLPPEEDFILRCSVRAEKRNVNE